MKELQFMTLDFQFTASYEADRGAGYGSYTQIVFQFTASYEADQRSLQ